MPIAFWLVFPGHVLLSFTFHLSNVLFFLSYNQYEAGLKSSLTLTLILIGAELCLRFFVFMKDPKYI